MWTYLDDATESRDENYKIIKEKIENFEKFTATDK